MIGRCAVCGGVRPVRPSSIPGGLICDWCRVHPAPAKVEGKKDEKKDEKKVWW
jgi:hypothetical protein